MATLLELQRQFETAVRTPSPGATPLWLNATGLAVYRNNLREGARRALVADYPVIARLVGDPCFRGLAIDYVGGHPSSSGDLKDFGHAFPPFLAGHFATTKFAYLADVAYLERALVECCADDGKPCAPVGALAAIDPARYGQLRLLPRANWDLCRSPYPVYNIWLANQPDADPGTLIELANRPEYVLVRGTEDGACVQRLSAGDFAFLHALRDTLALGVALERAEAIDPAFNAANSLFHVFEWRLISGLQLPPLT